MLATAGFLITALLLVSFAYSFNNLIKDSNKELQPFALAYLLIAAAFLMWGLISLNTATTSLAHTVLIGDAMLLSASICAASIYISRWKKAFLAASGIVAVVLLYARDKHYYPKPSLHQGILYFNTQRPVAILLSVLLIVAWLPACMKVARIVTDKAGLQRYYSLYASTYALAVISAALFIEARRREIIIASFVAFAACIVLLLVSNVLAQSDKRTKHAAK